jgi:hypothetical protein
MRSWRLSAGTAAAEPGDADLESDQPVSAARGLRPGAQSFSFLQPAQEPLMVTVPEW